jgi:hypothetical protein
MYLYKYVILLHVRLAGTIKRPAFQSPKGQLANPSHGAPLGVGRWAVHVFKKPGHAQLLNYLPYSIRAEGSLWLVLTARSPPASRSGIYGERAGGRAYKH